MRCNDANAVCGFAVPKQHIPPNQVVCLQSRASAKFKPDTSGKRSFSLADYAFHLAVQSRLRPGQTAVTVELKVNFLAPAKDGELRAAARIVSSGRRIIVCDIDVTGEDDKLIARCLGTYIVGGQAA